MPPFIYRCPNTGLNVQGWIADDPTEGNGETYQPFPCTICPRLRSWSIRKPARCSGLTKISRRANKKAPAMARRGRSF